MPNTQKCKDCHQLKVKKKEGNYFVDALGKTWSGKVCYECKKEQQKLAAQDKRLAHRKTCETCDTIVRRGRTVCYKCERKKIITSPNRHCRQCKKKLSPARYFYCSDCVPAYDTADINDIVPSLCNVSKEVGVNWRSQFIEEMYGKHACCFDELS